MAKNTAAGPQTVVVNCQAQRLETGAGGTFRGLVYPADVICYSPPVLETVKNHHELRMLLARLGIEDRDEVIGDAETVAPVRVGVMLSSDELRRITAGVVDGWWIA